MFRGIIIGLLLASCQVDDSDNYIKYTIPPEQSGYQELFQGQWCDGIDCLEIDSGDFCCLEDCALITTYQQKYLQIEHEVCGFGPIVAHQFRPPYNEISLLVSGKFVTYYKR